MIKRMIGLCSGYGVLGVRFGYIRLVMKKTTKDKTIIDHCVGKNVIRKNKHFCMHR